MTRVAYDPELMAQVVIRSLERHSYDSCSPITDCGIGTESMGSTICIRDWEQTYVADFAVQSKADVSCLKVPDLSKDGRMSVIIECEQILVGEIGDVVGVNGGLVGPLSFAARLRGTHRLLYDLVDDPVMVYDLFKISLEAMRSFGEAQVVRGGVGVVNVYDPVATLVSTSLADIYCFPYLEGLIRHLKEQDAGILLHICGDTKRYLGQMVDIGADILSLDADVDLVEAKAIVGDRATFSGNVATQNLCRLGPDAIHGEACRCIEKAATGGGRYTLSSSCEVPLETPAENIDAMVRAAREFGTQFLRWISAQEAKAAAM